MLYSQLKEVMVEIEKQVSKGKMFFNSYGMGDRNLFPEELNMYINREVMSELKFYVHHENNKKCYIVVCRYPSNVSFDVWLYMTDNNEMVYLNFCPVIHPDDIKDFNMFEELVLVKAPIKVFQWVFDN